MRKALVTLVFLVVAGTALAAESDSFEITVSRKWLLGQSSVIILTMIAFWKRSDSFIIRSTLSTEQIKESVDKLDRNFGEITTELRKLTRSNDVLVAWKESAVDDRKKATVKLEEMKDDMSSLDRRITVLEVQAG